MKKIAVVLLLFACVVGVSCKKKKDIEFTLTKLTLSEYPSEKYPEQNLYIRVVQLQSNGETALGQTKTYPSKYTLPVDYTVDPKIVMNFYKNDYAVELWGDSTGFIARNPIHLKDYKIIYPLEMETDVNGVSITLKGTWK